MSTAFNDLNDPQAIRRCARFHRQNRQVRGPQWTSPITVRANWFIVSLGLCWVLGCGPRNVPVSDGEQATQLLSETLQAWQSGATVEDQRQKTPPVYVAEEMWLGGTKLDRFEITQPAELFGTNVRLGVRLTCVDQRGSKREREVTYLVTTTPALTVAREDR